MSIPAVCHGGDGLRSCDLLRLNVGQVRGLKPGDAITIKEPDGIPFVRVQDLNLYDPPSCPGKKIAKEVEANYSRTRLNGGEILMAVVGSFGKLGIAPKAWAGANIARAVCRIAPSDQIDKGYLISVLQSMYVQQAFLDSTRTLAQPSLNISLIEKTPIPIAPVKEQALIVGKVVEMMALCNDLEAGLQKSQAKNDKLMEAAVAKLLAA